MQRLEHILIKVTEEEKEKIKQKAEQEGMTMSGFIRYLILKRGK